MWEKLTSTSQPNSEPDPQNVGIYNHVKINITRRFFIHFIPIRAVPDGYPPEGSFMSIENLSEARARSVRSKTRSSSGGGEQPKETKQYQESEQEPIQEPTSWKAALIRMLPTDNASLMGMIVQVACIVVGIIDYAHAQSLDRFLLMCGVGTGGSMGVQHVAKRLPSPRGNKPHDKPYNTDTLSD